MILRRDTTNEHQTTSLGESLGRCVRAGDIIAIRGELGAGKTRFVRGLAIGMGLDGADVSSPTFVLVHEYDRSPEESPGAGGAAASFGLRRLTPLVHVDAWRVDASQTTATLGLDRLRDASAVVVIEWADRLGALAPAEALRVHIEHVGPTSRSITLEGDASWSERLAGLRGEK